jgi:TetR/AcrR family transcriptional regulator
VEELDHVLGAGHEGVVDRALHEDGAHRHDAVGDALRRHHDVGHDVEVIRREGRAEPAEARDDLVEDEQDAVLVADLAQPLEVALRRHEHAGRARHRLDDEGGDGRGIVQRDDALELVGELGAVLGQAAGEGVAGGIVRVPDVVDAGEQSAEHLAVGDDPADRDAAEVYAVIAALAADEACARALALGAVISEGDLQCGLDGFGTRIREEDVVEPLGGDLRQARGELEGLRVRHLEGGGIVELGDLLLHRLDDFRPAMAGIDAPQPRGAVENRTAVVGVVVHVLGTGEEARRLLELAVRRERHPVGCQVVGNRTPHRHDIHGLILLAGPIGAPLRGGAAALAALASRILGSARGGSIEGGFVADEVRRAAPTPRLSRTGEANAERILDAALKVFAAYGFRGARIEEIAAASGLSKPNLLYYFRSKEALYGAVLRRTLEMWLETLRELDARSDPRQALTAYIERKLAYSRSHPAASRLFAMEVMQGAPHLDRALSGTLRDLVEAKTRTIEGWIGAGLMRPIDPKHLIFAIWATTQHYADFAPQIRAITGESLDDQAFYEGTRRTLTTILLDGALVPSESF